MPDWNFQRVTEAYSAITEAPCWDGEAVLFTHGETNRILRYDPNNGNVTDYRKFTNRINGLAYGPDGTLYGCQALSRRMVRINSDGSMNPLTYRFPDGGYHNMPNDVAVDSKSRVWFSDPVHRLPARGPARPFPGHESVLRLDPLPDRTHVLKRITFDTTRPNGILISRDDKTMYVADSDDDKAELRAYPVNADGSVGAYTVLHTWGKDATGRHRGIDGMTFDEDGSIVACAGSSRGGPGPMVYVFSPSGRVIETHPTPIDPINCCFGGPGLTDFYMTSQGGGLYKVANPGRKGWVIWPNA